MVCNKINVKRKRKLGSLQSLFLITYKNQGEDNGEREKKKPKKKTHPNQNTK